MNPNEYQYATSSNYEARLCLHIKFRTSPDTKFRRVFEHIPSKDGQTVLEIGCGTGLFWLANRERIPASWSITLTDYSAGMLEKTRRALSRIPHAFNYEVMDAANIKYPVDSFDTILANNVLYHIDERAKTIAQIARTLKDDGVFIASTIGKNNIWELNECLADFLGWHYGLLPFYENPFSLENGVEQLRQAFPKVEIFSFRDTLKIDEADAIVNYYLSLKGIHNDLAILPPQEKRGFLSAKRNSGQDIALFFLFENCDDRYRMF